MNPRPKCIIVAGQPGSGKTTLALQLSTLLHLPMLSRDQLKEGFVSTFETGHDSLPADTNRKVTDLFFDVAQKFLEANVSLIVEAAYQHRLWKEAVSRWSSVGQLFFLICEADPTVCAQRDLNRGLKDPSREFYHGDKRVKLFRETGAFLAPAPYDPPLFDVPTLRLSTADGYSPPLSVVIEFISKAEA